ncbi:GNAT family N-acetyltransferase [Acidipropionibacterium virtanenii]|uniref:N-acetyltransferase domain-containing protein n=1 Tax=Acidipropionibacterium virtanenii TaxID=2057246 RepID=A0A344UUU8_9ACTN|nr:GNAT family N-acetyltransferase [Acidipropionibacterium virtanenii]AXE39046.1 hypothetical protein JS278_01890 [Acidipropionibacterium virtanenii]
MPTSPVTDLEIHPADPGRIDDIAAVYGTRGGAAHCWCQYFTRPDWEFNQVETNRRGLVDHIRTDATPPGLIGYLDGEPVGWVALGPRSAYPRLWRSPADQTPEDPDLWAVTCFVIRVGFRRRGIATRLLDAAIEEAWTHGARRLFARPVDTSDGKRPGSDLYTGILSTFLAAGFAEIGRARRAVLVEKTLREPGTGSRAR